MRSLLILVVVLLSSTAITACSGPDEAKGFPGDGPSELIVPYAAGGGTDVMARAFAKEVGPRFPGGLRTVNLPGGGSVEGTRALVEAEADGHTIEFSDPGAHIVPPRLGGAPFATDDYVHVARLTTYGFAVAVSVDNDWADINDLIKDVRRSGGSLKIATAGALTIDVVAAHAFARKAGIKVTPVPFDSGGEAALAVASGEVDVAMMSMAAARSSQDGDLVHVLATTLAPDMATKNEPTMVDQGMDFTFEAWRGLVLPKGVPDDVVTFWGDTVDDLGDSDEWRAVVEERGETWDPLVGAKAADYVKRYEAQMRPILRAMENA